MHGKARRRRINAALLCADANGLQATIGRYAGMTEATNGDTTEQGDWAGWALAGRVDALLDGAGLIDASNEYDYGDGNGGAPVGVRGGALQRSALVAAQLRGTVRVLTAQIADLTAQVALLTAELAALHAQVDGEG
jgi:hypothetical protein